MLKEYSNLFTRLMITIDLCLVTVAFFLGYLLRNQMDGLYPFHYYLRFLPLILLIWLELLQFFGMYNSLRLRTFPEVTLIVFKSLVVGFILFGSILYILKIQNISRTLMFSIFVITALLIILKKIIMVIVLRHFRDKGYNFRNILLVGTGRRAYNFIKLVEDHREWGLKIIGLMDDDPQKVGESVKGYPVLGTIKDIPQIMHEKVIDELVFVVPGSWLNRIEETFLICETEGVRVHVAVDFYEPRVSRSRLSELHKFPFITFDSTSDKLGQLFIKRLFDVVFSVVALVVFFPLFGLMAVLIKQGSPGPVLFRQERCCLNGRRFILYKFRTMIQDAQERLQEILNQNEVKGPAFKMENDPRVTPLGKFLRRFSLDELPQLWNVLKGDMSLIGPRPPLPAEVEQYDAWHRRRLRMRPGLTCLWQVNGRNKITDFNEWAKMDLEYIDHWSLWLDVKIFLKTIPMVIAGIGAK